MSVLRISTIFCLALTLIAQDPAPDASALPIDRGAAGLWQALHKLHTRASLMMITAHPDDEDGGMLTYESRGQGARVMLLTLNRGESGANVMSPDFFDALGQVRTQELLAAGRYYGVEQYFTRVVNNGFSKTKEETLKSWSHERVLADAVRVVRATRPLVVTSVFIGGPSDGHGNHQVAGQTAQEVFKAAGDPKAFPEQIREGLHPWQPLKVYERIPRARVTEKGVYDYATHHWAPARVFDYVRGEWLAWALSADVTVPEGAVDPIAGLSYLQIAREGLGYQKSQNGGTGVPAAGEMSSPYHRFASAIPAAGKEESFFQGIDTSLAGIADLARESHPDFLREGLARINAAVEQAIANFQPAEPARIASTLGTGWKETNRLIEQVSAASLTDRERYDVLHELRAKQQQFNTALALALQLTMEATVAPDRPRNGMAEMFGGTPDSFRMAIPGQQFRVNVHVNNAGNTPVHLAQVRLATPAGENWAAKAEVESVGALSGNKPKDVAFRVTVPQNAQATRPYFSRPNVEQAWYDIQNPADLTRPFTPYPVAAWAKVEYEGVTVEIGQVVQSVRHVNGEGSVMQPLIVAPAISVSASPSAGILPLGSQSFTLVANVHSNVKGPAQGKVRVDLPAGWRSEPASRDFKTAKDGDDQRLEFRVFPTQLLEQHYSIQAVAEYNGREYREGFRVTGYEGLRPDLLYRPATYKAAAVDVRVAPNLNIGYVMGSGDEVPQSIENLGVHPKLLTSADLASGDLSKFDAILLGVRTYAVRDDLKTNNARLLDYVKNGGVVVVQYNTPEFDHNFGPYPYTMTNDPEEVTDEESKMNILAPDNPIFSWPNKIGEKDFEGWVSERGSKFMESWDARYTPLLETHDPEQDPQKGGLLYARYGKGVYIYNAYAFYRQLPEGVPGAYRIMANLISLAKNPNLNQKGDAQ
jgi:LmbE family N-acetylglucosaminyl deacetylase